MYCNALGYLKNREQELEVGMFFSWQQELNPQIKDILNPESNAVKESCKK